MPHSKGYKKLRREIKKLPDYNRGYFTDFYNGYIHGIHDHSKYGDITEEEAVELKDMFEVEEKNES